MKRRMPRKLTVARETLGRLEEGGLQEVAGGAGTKTATGCICRTETCVTLIYSNCNLMTCNCA